MFPEPEFHGILILGKRDHRPGCNSEVAAERTGGSAYTQCRDQKELLDLVHGG
jgi:hypothetical protein